MQAGSGSRRLYEHGDRRALPASPPVRPAKLKKDFSAGDGSRKC